MGTNRIGYRQIRDAMLQEKTGKVRDLTGYKK